MDTVTSEENLREESGEGKEEVSPRADDADSMLGEEKEESFGDLLNQSNDTLPEKGAVVKYEEVPFDYKRVETWGVYIEQLDQEVTHEELYMELRNHFNLHETKGLRCLLKLLDCVVIWAERSQAYYVAGKDWRQEGNLYQGQLLLDTLRATINEFVCRLGPYRVFHNQEMKRSNLRPDNYPQWKRVPCNGKKLTEPEKAVTYHPVASKEEALAIVCVPNTVVAPSPVRKSRRRTMADLKRARPPRV